MKIFSFNVNGLRARLHQMRALINKHSPDIICLQETKVDNENYPMESINELGYKALINGQKGHYGVSTLYKSDPVEFQIGFPTDNEDAQCRLISSKHKFSSQEITIINGYFPQGESRDHPKKFPYKEKFFKDLMQDFNNIDDISKNWIPAQEKINLDNNIKLFKTHHGKYTVGGFNFTDKKEFLATFA